MLLHPRRQWQAFAFVYFEAEKGQHTAMGRLTRRLSTPEVAKRPLEGKMTGGYPALVPKDWSAK